MGRAKFLEIDPRSEDPLVPEVGVSHFRNFRPDFGSWSKGNREEASCFRGPRF